MSDSRRLRKRNAIPTSRCCYKDNSWRIENRERYRGFQRQMVGEWEYNGVNKMNVSVLTVFTILILQMALSCCLIGFLEYLR